MTHYITKCSCGEIISQCRCMAPDKTIEIVDRGCKKCKAQDGAPRKAPGPPDPPKLPFEIWG